MTEVKLTREDQARLRGKVISMLGEEKWDALTDQQRDFVVRHEALHERALNSMINVALAIKGWKND